MYMLSFYRVHVGVRIKWKYIGVDYFGRRSKGIENTTC
jgi:hypothetical protein